MTEHEALQWVFKFAGKYLKPWEAWTNYTDQETVWHCWGCEGKFISRWPNWIEPTDETFLHGENCKYMAAKKLSE